MKQQLLALPPMKRCRHCQGPVLPSTYETNNQLCGDCWIGRFRIEWTVSELRQIETIRFAHAAPVHPLSRAAAAQR